jgi:hypothetical protein
VTVRRRLAAVAAAGALLAAPATAAGQQADPTRLRDPTLARRLDSALPRAAVAARQTWVRGTQMGERARELAAQRAAAQMGTPPREPTWPPSGAAATTAIGDDLRAEAAAELARRAAAEPGTAAAPGPANVEPRNRAGDLGRPVASNPPPFVQRGACARETRARVAGFVSWLRTLPGGDALAAVVAERAADARCDPA